MTRKTILTLGAAAALLIGAIAVPAIAHDDGRGPMMQRMHGERDQRGAGPMMRDGDHEGRGGMRMGGMGMQRLMASPVYQSFDADADGTVTPAELDAGLAALHATHDADGNGTLSAEEFAELFAAFTRNMADRPFATLDADGDGQISAAEMAFPAQMMARRQAWRDAAPATPAAPQ